MPGKIKLVSNSISILINRVTQSIATFVLTAAISRLLGARELGQYLLAFSFYYIFMSLASQGLKVLFTRELSKRPEDIEYYFVNGTLLQLLLSIVSYILLVGIVYLLPYSSETSNVCYIFALAIVPFSLSNITEAIFQAQERMHLIAISTVPIYIIRLLIIIWSMRLGYGINTASIVMALSEVIILFVQWVAIFQQLPHIKWKIDIQFMLQTLWEVRTFLAIEGIAIFGQRMQILILSVVGSEVLVGLFGGITQLMQPFLIIAESINLAIFPSLSKASNLDRKEQQSIAEGIADILACAAIPFCIGILYFGNDLLLFVFDDPNFSQATLALNLVALTLVSLCFMRPLCYVLVANGLERINLHIASITTISNLILGAILISKFQLLGAALNVFIIRIAGFLMTLFYTDKNLFKMHRLKTLRRSMLLGSLMVVVFEILRRNAADSFITTLAIATIAYLLIAALLVALSSKGRSYIREKLSSGAIG
jgi:O-antigen/teichoic acid export membrane protein